MMLKGEIRCPGWLFAKLRTQRNALASDQVPSTRNVLSAMFGGPAPGAASLGIRRSSKMVMLVISLLQMAMSLV